MKPTLHPEAEREVREAHQYYESRREGLGDELVREIDRAIAAACANQERWPRLGPTVRRCQTDKFKYAVIYHVLGNELEVLAVMDMRRRPGYWRRRLRK